MSFTKQSQSECGWDLISSFLPVSHLLFSQHGYRWCDASIKLSLMFVKPSLLLSGYDIHMFLLCSFLAPLLFCSPPAREKLHGSWLLWPCNKRGVQPSTVSWVTNRFNPCGRARKKRDSDSYCFFQLLSFAVPVRLQWKVLLCWHIS